MNKQGAGTAQVVIMVLFALSCFGLLLFLWVAFGGPVPLRKAPDLLAVAKASCAACLGGPSDTFGRLNTPISCISTTNRNFPGRMGHKEAKVFLAIANRVYKGRGERFMSSQTLLDSDLGKLILMNFDEVSANTFGHLIEASAAIRSRMSVVSAVGLGLWMSNILRRKCAQQATSVTRPL